MQWYDLFLSLISLRSFSVLWYWIALWFFWSVVTRRVLGVPGELAIRAQSDPRAAEEALWFARFEVRRRMAVSAPRRMIAVTLLAFAASALLTLALSGLEAAQALLPFLLPWILIEALRERLARRLMRDAPGAEALAGLLIWHKIAMQAIAGGTIFLTFIWGAWRNLSLLMP
ncbi:hypothetical protein [Falsirhodobacter algicola]|uniref:Component of SufBCD complex n=1 Tax=Falsirhodobacter algicola TaxID=2692330 RepID=A0A8J8MSH5_9RHOB|nr:hypothetical protein [Falsirhodobacter algicola]QUS35468.1 hypothetical protein GR316_03800 [Falsirhodobacter algicola]